MKQMKRELKYPDTGTFHYFNANPRNRITGDCKYRAISTATGIPYNTVVMEMAELQCETGYAGADIIGKYLERKGWVKHKQPKHTNGTKYTGYQFCQIQQYHLFSECDKEGITVDGCIELSRAIVANIGSSHIVAIMDGKVWDIWDSTDDCIGNYWTRKE